MARAEVVQLNVRSRFARERVAEIVRQTGMSTTQVVEEALRAFVPPVTSLPPGFVRKGPLIVKRSEGRTITIEDVQAAIDAARDERDDAVANPG